jgi:hypothetical protein
MIDEASPATACSYGQKVLQPHTTLNNVPDREFSVG